MASRPVLTEALASTPFFTGLDSSSLERIGAGMRARRFRRGEVIFHAGDPGNALFVIVAGSVNIVISARSGDEAILATLGPGEVFGELALLDGAPRSATATAAEATETVTLAREQFSALVASEPTIRDALLASLASELRRLTRHVEDLHFLDVTGRLAARLGRLARTSGTPVEDGEIRLVPTPTQGELAAMVGCSRQTANRLLGQFAADGLIRIERDAIVVIDLERLASTARR